MSNYRVNSCCCFSLRTGTLIMGWLGTICNALAALTCIGLFFVAKMVMEAIRDEAKKNGENPLTPEEFDTALTVLKIGLGIGFIFCIIATLIHVMLLIGVYQERPSYIKVYVILLVIGFVLSVLYNAGSVLGMMVNGHFGAAIVELLSSLIGLAISLYIILVIHSHRMELIERPKRGGMQQQF